MIKKMIKVLALCCVSVTAYVSALPISLGSADIDNVLAKETDVHHGIWYVGSPIPGFDAHIYDDIAAGSKKSTSVVPDTLTQFHDQQEFDDVRFLDAAISGNSQPLKNITPTSVVIVGEPSILLLLGLGMLGAGLLGLGLLRRRTKK